MTQRLLGPNDCGTIDEIIKLSDCTLKAGLADRWPRRQSFFPFLRRQVPSGKWLGTERLCLDASDAVTRAAHYLGLVASREQLVGYHFITSFAPLDQPPSADDLVLCRTWGQYNKLLYNGSDPRSGKSFFGTRQELMGLLPDNARMFAPEGVLYRQVVHRPVADEYSPSPEQAATLHVWLRTTPQEVMSGEFQIGEVALGAYPGREWA